MRSDFSLNTLPPDPPQTLSPYNLLPLGFLFLYTLFPEGHFVPFSLRVLVPPFP